jgi:WD40 repeat protein
MGTSTHPPDELDPQRLREIREAIVAAVHRLGPKGSSVGSTAVVAGISASALTPLLLPLAAGTLPIAATAALFGSLGQNLIASVLYDWRASRQTAVDSHEELERIVLRRLMTADPLERKGLSQFLVKIDAVQIAIAAADDDEKLALAGAFRAFGTEFAEFGWMLHDVRDGLVEVAQSVNELQALIREQLARSSILPAPELSSSGKSALEFTTTVTHAALCPYKGLASFAETDADLFFGRERLVAQIAGRLLEAPFLAIIGTSGSGKTSAVNAGLLPSIWRGELPGGEQWKVVRSAPSMRPLPGLAAAVGCARDAWHDSGAPARAVRRAAAELPPEAEHLLVVDPFEAVFTVCPSETEREQYARALAAIAQVERSRVIVVIRADFYARCLELTALIDLIQEQQMVVRPMSEHELRDAIVRPAARAGVTMDAALPDVILRDLKDEPGALPLLSHALSETWSDSGGQSMTVAAYEHSGGVRNAIAQTAERVFTELGPDLQELCRRLIVRRLIDVSADGIATRRTAVMADLVATGDPAAEQVIDRLAAGRLLVVDEAHVAIAHEALLREWPRLQDWLDQDALDDRIHRRLIRAAAEWNRDGRDSGLLYVGARLNEAGTWAGRGTDALNPVEREFLIASLHVEQQQESARQRQVRRLRALVMGVLAVAGIAVAFGVYAAQQRGEARKEAADAWARQLTFQASALGDRRPDLGVLVASEAYRYRPAIDSRIGLLAALHERPSLKTALWPFGRPCSCHQAIAYGAGGTLLAAADGSSVTLWRTVDHRYVGGLAGRGAEVMQLAFSADGGVLAVSDLSGVRVFNTANWKLVGGVNGSFPGSWDRVAFTPDGHLVTTSPGQLTVWEPTTMKVIAKKDLGYDAEDLAIASDGREIATLHNRDVAIWDPRGLRPVRHLEPDQAPAGLVYAGSILVMYGPASLQSWNFGRAKQPSVGTDRFITAVAVDPTTFHMAVGFDDGTIRQFNPWTRQFDGDALQAGTIRVSSLAYRPDGRGLVSGDDALRLWDLGDKTRLGRRLRIGSTVDALAFTPDSRELVISSIQGMVAFAPETGRRVFDSSSSSRAGKVAYDPRTGTFLAVGDGGTVRAYDARTGADLGPRLKGAPPGYPKVLTVSPAGDEVAVTGDHEVKVFHMPDGHVLRHVLLTNPAGVAFLDAGRSLIMASIDGLTLLDIRSGRARRTLKAPVAALAVGPRGNFVAAAGVDGSIRIVDPRSGREVSPPLVGPRLTDAVALSPDGSTVASSGDDNTLQLWDRPSGRALGPPLVSDVDGIVGALAFSPSGQFLAAGSSAGDMRIWSSLAWSGDVARLRRAACSLVGRGLTAGEWHELITRLPYARTC